MDRPTYVGVVWRLLDRGFLDVAQRAVDEAQITFPDSKELNDLAEEVKRAIVEKRRNDELRRLRQRGY